MASSKKMGVRSFFGGPVSTRENCKAAVNGFKQETGECHDKAKALIRDRSTGIPKQQSQLKPTPGKIAPQRKHQLHTGNGTAVQKKKKVDIQSRNPTVCPKMTDGWKLNGMGSETMPKKYPGVHVNGRGRTRMKMCQANRGIKTRQGQTVKRATAPMAADSEQPIKNRSVSSSSVSGVKKRKMATGGEAVVQPQKKVQRTETPKLSPHESFFDRMRRSTQGRVSQTYRGRVEAVNPAKRRAREDNNLADFIDDDDDEYNQDESDWKAELRKTTGYNPTKFKDDFDDVGKHMESSLHECWREERRSLHLGRLEDQREFERDRKRKGTKQR